MSKSGAAKHEGPLRSGLLHDTLGHLFRRSHLRSQQAFAKAFDGSGLSPLQYGILELVELNPGLTHGELAEGMVTAPSVVTTAVKPLLEAGFLVKRSQDHDGRRAGYSLSPAGTAFFTALRGHILEAEELLLAPLNVSERRSLKRLLHRLTASGRL
ncbi:MarR family winged helix-turn-helix transcriptional regulator [Pelagibius sp. CAU 1746]|uniref:MarR family winged helix-turn-helix transcriptional regulator n=1 Tax=Pelagibius sp. CAU 1746 TaxID=3140370 RepID=UPI00325AD785